MNKKKSDEYLQLVKAVHNTYKIKHSNNNVTLRISNSEWEKFCKEINLYTYWQGYGYADATPEIDYLLVGQDWGDPCLNNNASVRQRIDHMNKGKQNINYIDLNDPKQFDTDMNLAELFKVLDIGNEQHSIIDTRYSNVFFTNFCLGYREGKQSGGMSKGMMNIDKDHFVSLCRILEPKKIICLGKITFECVYEALTDKRASQINHFKDSYNKFLSSQNGFTATYNGITSEIYPVAHCGTIGTLNRNIIIKGKKKIADPCIPKGNPLFLQKKDWEKIR